MGILSKGITESQLSAQILISGEVEYFSELPSAINSANDIYIVLKDSGVAFINKKHAGLYYSDGSSWLRLGDLTNMLKSTDVINDLVSTNIDKPLSANQGKLLQDTKLADVIEDTTPQLGGNLDLNSSDITGTGNININGEIEATTLIGDLRGATEFQAKAGEDITKGDPLYISSFDVSGNKPIVGIADADDSNKMPCFGLAKDTASNNSTVNVVTFGTLAGLNTSSFTLGDILYISTSGALTNIKPAGESAKIQNIGKVQRVHASSGSIKVGGAGRTNDVPNLNLGNVFIGNSSNQAETRGITLDDISETATYKLLTTTNNTKLNNITLNQAIDLDTVLFNVAINNLKITNATHTGDVTGSTALTITDQAVTDAKLFHVASGTVKGRTTAGTGIVENIIIDTDLTTVSSNDDTLASAKAIKTYVDANSGGIDPRDTYTQNSGQYIATEEIKARDANGLKLYNDGGSGIFVADNGKVGIGNNSPVQNLSIGANLGSSIQSFGLGVEGSIVTGTENYNNVIGLNNYGSGSKLFSYNYGSSTGTPIYIQPDNANVYLSRNGGNVGIGNDTPSERLDVSGNATISGKLGIGKVATDTTILDMERSETSGGGLSIRLKNTNTTSGSSHASLVLLGNNGGVQAQYYADGFGGTAYLRTFTNHPLSIGTNAQERMRIEADGKVKINDRLGIGKDPGQYAVLDMEMAVTSGAGAGINLKNTASGPSYAVLNLYGNNGGVAGQFYAGGGQAVLRTYTNHGLIFGTNGSERVRITNSGKVGIGTSNPSQKLHVNGNAIVSGSLSKGSGSFDIAHPDPDKKDTHRLRHYFVETPSAGGNIYKYQIKCKEGNNYIDLPDYFQFLNKDSLVWVNPYKHFGRAWGQVQRNKKLKIVVEKKGIYNILIFGDRKDETAMKDFNKYGIEYKNK